MDIGLVGEQIIQGSGVGKGGIFAHGSVEALLLSVRAKCRRIKGNNGRTAGLSTENAFDRRVHRLRHIQLARNQTLLLFSLHIAVIIVPRPADSRIVLGKTAVHSKNQVSALHQLLPAVCQSRMGLGVFRLPCVKIGQNRFGNRGIHGVQQAVMQFPTGPETVPASLRLAFFIRAQQVAGIVPEEVWENADGTSHW